MLVSNGIQSFVFFLYAEILETANFVSAGFNSGDVRSVTIPNSLGSSAFMLPESTNVGRNGTWAFRVDRQEIQLNNCDAEGKYNYCKQSLMCLSEIPSFML